jgi:hypothetical protein
MSFEIPKTMKVVGFENSENLKIQDLTLCCAIINERFSEYYVMTNKQKFEKIISDASNESRENQILMFKILHENINKYTDEQLYKCFNEKIMSWIIGVMMLRYFMHIDIYYFQQNQYQLLTHHLTKYE